MVICVQVQRVAGAGAAGIFRYRFDAEEVLVGRSAAVDVRLPDARVSLVHARIVVQGRDLLLEDLGSSNGTRCEGRLLTANEPVALARGLGVHIGPFRLELIDDQAALSSTFPRDTASYARRMLLEVLEAAKGRAELMPYLEVLSGPTKGERQPLVPGGGPLLLGRSEECGLRLVDADVSRRHAEALTSADGTTLRDLGSRNGAFVNDERVQPAGALCLGDRLRLGNTLLRFFDPADDALAGLQGDPAAGEPPSAREQVQRAGELIAAPGAAPPLPPGVAFELVHDGSVRAASQLSGLFQRSQRHSRSVDLLLAGIAVALVAGAAALLWYLMR